MLGAILVGLACESATPLPPPKRPSTLVTKQMVEAGDVRGYLVRPETSQEGVLLLAAQLDAATRRQAEEFTGSTVLVISPRTSVEKSEAYLKGSLESCASVPSAHARPAQRSFLQRNDPIHWLVRRRLAQINLRINERLSGTAIETRTRIHVDGPPPAPLRL